MFDIIGESEIVYEGRTIGHLKPGLAPTFITHIDQMLNIDPDAVSAEDHEEIVNELELGHESELEHMQAAHDAEIALQEELQDRLQDRIEELEAGIVALHKKLQALSNPQ